MAKNGSLAAIVALASSFFAMMTTVALSRILGANEYGQYAFVFAIISILAIPTQVGLPQLVVRETAKAMEAKHFGRMLQLWQILSYHSRHHVYPCCLYRHSNNSPRWKWPCDI